MSKLSFRARALDATKPLPIYNAVDLPDLSEYNTINRTVPQMPTGMEKEEETERHLQDVILAQQTNNTNKHIVIPTPENAIHVTYYEQFTTRMDRPPPQYIRLPGLSLDEDVPDYDLDSEDEEWLNLQTNEKRLSCLHFERMMDRLEKGSGNTVLSPRGAQALLKDDDDLVLAVYDYWLAKRLRLGRALIPVVKQERRDGSSSGSNPYLAFRKRTEKMQTRKNRKNDETAYMQMQKLKRDLDRALTLTGMVKEREAKKHLMAGVQMDIFKKRYLLEDWSGSIMSSLCPVATHSATSRQNSNVSNSAWDGSSVLIKMEGGDDYDVHQLGRHEVLVSTGLKRKRKKKYYFPSNSVESPLPPMPSTPDKVNLDPSRDMSDKLEEDLDGKYTFKRRPYVKYCSARAHIDNWPWEDDVGYSGGGSDGEMEEASYTTRTRMPKPKRFRFSRLTLSGQYAGLCRRRVGRGGRTMFDRSAVDHDPDRADNMDADPMETESSQIATPPNSAAPGLPSPGHTPTSPSHMSNSQSTPSPLPLARQRSEIVAPSLAGGRVSGLVRSQSVQAVPSSSRADMAVPASTDGEGEGAGQQSAQKGVARHTAPKKSLNFVDSTPSSTSTLEFPSLPFINQPPPFLDSTEHAHQMSFPYADYHSVGDEAFVGDSFSFRRLPSSDREEMMSFSSLPTSHFTLRPSSSDMESDKPPTQYWYQPTFGYVPADSESWNWNQPAAERFSNGRKRWLRRTGNEPFSGSGSVSHPPPPLPPPPSAPSNYGSNLFHGTRSHPIKHNVMTMQQQVAPDQKKPALAQANKTQADKKDVSRSSLSVTDSKTIVLTNSPTPWHSAGDKKKEAEKLLSQQQHNHRLPNSTAQRKSRVSPPGVGEQESKKVVPDGTGETVKGGDGDTKSEGVVNSVKDSKGVAADEKAKKPEESSDNSDKKVQTKSDQAPSSGTSAIAASGPDSSEAASVPTKNPSKEADSPVEERKAVEIKKSPRIVDVWSMRGPANGILSLNVSTDARRRDKSETKKSSKGSMESALIITSQFASKIVKKKEEGTGNSDVLPPPLGGILVRGTAAAGNRSGSNTPTILGSADLVTQQKLASIGGIGAMVTGLGVGKIPVELARAPPPPVVSAQENTVTTVSQGTEVKRTNSVSDRVGAASHVILSQPSAGGVVRPAVSTGTNGTSIQEILNTTKRKLSESKGQGLKQALAGTVMNHNSILETAAKPLVTPTLKNSSEVT